MIPILLKIGQKLVYSDAQPPIVAIYIWAAPNICYKHPNYKKQSNFRKLYQFADNLSKTMQPIWLNLGQMLEYCDCQSGLIGFYIRAASNCFYKHQIYKKQLNNGQKSYSICLFSKFTQKFSSNGDETWSDVNIVW